MRSVQSASRYEVAAWIVAAAALVLVLKLQLLTALLGGLLVYELVHIIARRFELTRLSSVGARMVAVVVLSILIITLITSVVLGLLAFFHSDAGSLSALMKKLAEILDTSRAFLPPALVSELPADAESLRETAVSWLRKNAGGVESMGRELGRILVQLVIGMIIGAMISLREVESPPALPPFAAALMERVHRFAEAFRRVVFAQVRIAAINAVLTALYVAVALPLLGIELPFGKTLVVVTFLCGLIPVVGNLVSNTIIVVVSLSRGVPVAFASLVFLIVIHKLEYFLNARIVGTQIHARPWELLVAMLVMEAAFGFGGVAAAPIYYAYLKDELTESGNI